MTIRAVTYPIFIKRAEKRLLELRDTSRDAPFLKEQRIDPKCNPKTYLRAQQPR